MKKQFPGLPSYWNIICKINHYHIFNPKWKYNKKLTPPLIINNFKKSRVTDRSVDISVLVTLDMSGKTKEEMCYQQNNVKPSQTNKNLNVRLMVSIGLTKKNEEEKCT